MLAASTWLLFAAGVAVSLGASWLLVSRLERLGERAGFSEAWLGLVKVVGASAVMEVAATALGRRYAVAGIVTGALVLAVVTSLPNAVTAVYLARKGRGAAVLSTALNSNAINVTVGLLVPASLTGLGPPAGQEPDPGRHAPGSVRSENL
jgi:Ca2+/Na+ antiporter